MTADRIPSLAAVVLAGGRALRMGGGDKSLRLLGGRPLLERVVARLAPQVGRIAISANGNPARFDPYGLPVLADTIAAHPGPLAGILAGMQWAAGLGASHILSMPTDTPLFPLDLAARLAAASVADVPVLAASDRRLHPAIGMWPVDLAARLADFLLAGQTFKVSAFADACGATSVEFAMIELAGRSIDPFFNVNSLQDLAFAESLLTEFEQ
jgi:molybdopterin-guanine dinucleotide biosynthesis protein A